MKRVLIWAWCYVRGTWANIYGVCSVYFRHLYRLSLNSFQRCTRVRGFYHFFLDLCWIFTIMNLGLEILRYIDIHIYIWFDWMWTLRGLTLAIYLSKSEICAQGPAIQSEKGEGLPWTRGILQREREVLWLVVWLPFFIFPYIGNSHPNWLSYFSRGVAQPPTCSPFFHGDVKKIRGLGQLEIQPIAKVIPQLMVDTSPRLNIIPLN